MPWTGGELPPLSSFGQETPKPRARRAWSFERVPSLLPSHLERDRGLFGRSCAGQAPTQKLGIRYATAKCWPGACPTPGRGTAVAREVSGREELKRN